MEHVTLFKVNTWHFELEIKIKRKLITIGFLLPLYYSIDFFRIRVKKTSRAFCQREGNHKIGKPIKYLSSGYGKTILMIIKRSIRSTTWAKKLLENSGFASIFVTPQRKEDPEEWTNQESQIYWIMDKHRRTLNTTDITKTDLI